MAESPFGFSYSWQDLKPIRTLAVTVIVLQIIGAGLFYWLALKATWFEDIWLGGALFTLPGYLLGLVLQHKTEKDSIKNNKTMVFRMGLIALALTLVGLFFPDIGLIHSL